MKGQHYGTLPVQRFCVMPGMLVRHDGQTWKAGASRKGKLVLSTMHCNKLISDNEVEIMLDGYGNPLGDYPSDLFDLVYHANNNDFTDVISSFVKGDMKH